MVDYSIDFNIANQSVLFRGLFSWLEAIALLHSSQFKHLSQLLKNLLGAGYYF